MKLISFILFISLAFLWFRPLMGEGVTQPTKVLKPKRVLTDEEIAQIARQRSYPGGIHEEDLKVQDSLQEPYSKLNIQKMRKQVEEELLVESQTSSKLLPSQQEPQ